jgi:hypothetical protein
MCVCMYAQRVQVPTSLPARRPSAYCIYVYVYACMDVKSVSEPTYIYLYSLHLPIMYVCMYVCAERVSSQDIYTLDVYVYIYMCVCVCIYKHTCMYMIK